MQLNRKRHLFSRLILTCLWAPCVVVAGPTSVYREIQSVDISAQVKSTAEVDAKVCAGFKLGAQRVKALLRAAREIDVRSYAHDLDVSPCTIEGQLTLQNGLKGKWQAQMAGGIRVEFEDQRVMLLDCSRCGKPFVN